MTGLLLDPTLYCLVMHALVFLEMLLEYEPARKLECVRMGGNTLLAATREADDAKEAGMVVERKNNRHFEGRRTVDAILENRNV